ncbi:MAG: PDZ domain-containing protein [Anaerolineales bacterium]|nr:PDZ domain-containing protein [Anaerolineales bacterium]
MSTRGTILLAVGMLILGLVLGAALGGTAGFFAGQNARLAVSRNVPALQLPVQPNQPAQGTERAPSSGLPPAMNVIGGARVEEVEKDSPADKAGLQVGDVITAVGSAKLDAKTALADVIKTYKPGDKIELAITRGAQTLKLTVELGAATDNKDAARLGIRYTPMVPGGRFRFPDG